MPDSPSVQEQLDSLWLTNQRLLGQQYAMRWVIHYLLDSSPEAVHKLQSIDRRIFEDTLLAHLVSDEAVQAARRLANDFLQGR